MIHECTKTKNSRARKNERHPVISHGSAIRHFKHIATDWWWVRSGGRLGFYAKTKHHPQGIYVTGNLN